MSTTEDAQRERAQWLLREYGMPGTRHHQKDDNKERDGRSKED